MNFKGSVQGFYIWQKQMMKLNLLDQIKITLYIIIQGDTTTKMCRCKREHCNIGPCIK